MKEDPTTIQTKYETLFEAGKHQEAISFLKEARVNFEPALYHYNLGINYGKEGELAMSRYHLEAAKSHGFYAPELRESLGAVKDLSGASRMEQKGSVMDYVYQTSLSASLYTGANLSLILLIAVIIQFKRMGAWWARALVIFLALIPFCGQLYFKKNYDRAIVMQKKSVLLGPSNIFEQSQELIPAMMVVVSDEYEGWRYVASPISHRGWTKAEYLQLLGQDESDPSK